MSNQNHCCSEQHRPRQTAKTNPGNNREKNIYTQSCPLRQKLPDKMSNQNHCCSEQHRQRQTVSPVLHVYADVAHQRRRDAWSSYDDTCTVTPVTPTPSRPPTCSHSMHTARTAVVLMPRGAQLQRRWGGVSHVSQPCVVVGIKRCLWCCSCLAAFITQMTALSAQPPVVASWRG